MTSWIEWRDPATMKCHTVCFGEVVDYPCLLKVGEIDKGQACVHLVVTCRAIPFFEEETIARIPRFYGEHFNLPCS
jgi:hypothetical protein